MNGYNKPLPRIDGISAPYWQGTKQHELRLQVCDSCGIDRYPPKAVCPGCLSTAASWKAMSGRGSVWSWIVMHQPYLHGFRDELPYVVLWVELAEGPMIMTNLVESDPQALRCGAPVSVRFVDVTSDITLPQFRLTEAGA